MCKELYHRWEKCDCYGFISLQPCKDLYATCMGPRGFVDKKVIKTHQGMCSECLQRKAESGQEGPSSQGKGKRRRQ